MSVTYKRVFRKNPATKDGTGKFHPQLVIWGKPATLESLATQMKESSSLTMGDIKSVLTNFVTAMRTELYNGHSVNIAGFGVFRLAASTRGSDTREKCNADLIKSVRILFRASSSIRPTLNPATTRSEDRIDFVDLDSQLAKLSVKPSESDDNTSASPDKDKESESKDQTEGGSLG